MSVLLPNDRAWLVANWVSFGFFHDAVKWLSAGSQLTEDIRFCSDAEVDTLDASSAGTAVLNELKGVVERVIANNRAAGASSFHDPTGFPVYMEKLEALHAEVASAIAEAERH